MGYTFNKQFFIISNGLISYSKQQFNTQPTGTDGRLSRNLPFSAIFIG